MGKALAIGAVVIILALILAWFSWKALTFRPPAGDLDRKRERQLWNLAEEASQIMLNLGVKYQIEDSDYLTQESQSKVNAWVDRYHKFTDQIQKELHA